MNLLIIALAPILIILVYVYVRDKYEKEPIGLLIKTLVVGAFTVIPIIFVEKALQARGASLTGYSSVAYTAFVVAAFSEEVFKFIALYFLIWKRKEFNEKFDGIVYAVFISLGFAAVENVMYVFQYGHATGIARALTAVPGHALFGVAMGYYFGMAKLSPKNKTKNFLLALIVPIGLHGLYDFILMTEHEYLIVAFIPFLYYLWKSGFKRMKEHSDKSKFR
ncbi:MAG: PrsW family intramembrane metalloprotease [Bacteroidetes bacterium]|nr:MAG: PrsW family intramembrane metalloprotease [Bacteroidota bacterium]